MKKQLKNILRIKSDNGSLIPEDNIQAISKPTVVPLRFFIKKSDIHGNGTFCTEDVPKQTDLGLSIPFSSETDTSRIFFRNTFGLLINDSKTPNAKTVKMDDGWHFVSIKPIKKDEEILVDYDEYADKVDLESFISGKRVAVI